MKSGKSETWIKDETAVAGRVGVIGDLKEGREKG